MWLRQRTSRAAQALALLSSAALLWCLVQQRGNVGSAVADHSNSALSPNSVADADVLLAADDFYPRFRQFKLQENNAARADGDDRRDDERHLAVKPAVATTAADVSRVASDVKPWQRIAGLETIFLSVKTTGRYHRQRLGIIVDTWFTLADEQTYFFTDEDDVEVNEKARGHLINTNCSASHLPRDLCCKMSAEYDAFMESEKKWFCHFDDDNYVNVASLARFLSRMDPREDLYLGRPSLSRKLDLGSWRREDRASFWFATGGAGFCLSRSLALKMRPYASGGKLQRVCDLIKFPDDVSIGYIVEHLLKKNLTKVYEFHSHLEQLDRLNKDTLHDQLSFSYGVLNKRVNAVDVFNYTVADDPTRFKALHCHLYPRASLGCPWLP